MGQAERGGWVTGGRGSEMGGGTWGLSGVQTAAASAGMRIQNTQTQTSSGQAGRPAAWNPERGALQQEARASVLVGGWGGDGPAVVAADEDDGNLGGGSSQWGGQQGKLVCKGAGRAACMQRKCRQRRITACRRETRAGTGRPCGRQAVGGMWPSPIALPQSSWRHGSLPLTRRPPQSRQPTLLAACPSAATHGGGCSLAGRHGTAAWVERAGVPSAGWWGGAGSGLPCRGMALTSHSTPCHAMLPYGFRWAADAIMASHTMLNCATLMGAHDAMHPMPCHGTCHDMTHMPKPKPNSPYAQPPLPQAPVRAP